MEFRIEHRKKSKLQVGLFYAAIGMLGFVLSYIVKDLSGLIPPCMFHLITGVPCPACGATRTGVMLSHFQIADAFMQNPLFFVLFVALVMWGINSMVGLLIGKNATITLYQSERKIMRWILIFAIPLNWLYLILAH